MKKPRKVRTQLWPAPARGERLTSERYLGLRGIVNHLIGRESDPKNSRHPVGNMTEKIGEKRNWGTCKWCLMPVEPGPSGRGKLWHESCADWKLCASGTPTGNDMERGPMVEVQTPSGYTNYRELCPACGKAGFVSFELDHIMSIGVAKRLGEYFYRRAFSPDNLWWICNKCHDKKTAFDMAFMRSLDNPVTAEEELTPWVIIPPEPPPTPLFDWFESQSNNIEEESENLRRL